MPEGSLVNTVSPSEVTVHFLAIVGAVHLAKLAAMNGLLLLRDIRHSVEQVLDDSKRELAEWRSLFRRK
jgi:hypothetical protein